jgi:hypothetical protein
MTSVRDVLTFVQMHLRDGLTPDGTRILSTESAAAMRERQVDVLDSSARGDSWGLGWSRFGWDGERLIGHDGGTIGQTAYLRIMPAQNFAVALLINGGDAAALYEDIFAEVFRELTDMRMPAPFGPPADRPVVDVNPYVGRYRRLGFDTMVSNRDGVLVLRTTATGPLGGLLPELTSEHELVPVGKDHFAIRRAATSTWESVRFHTLSDGTAYLYFHNGARANKRIEIPREATDT